MNNSYLYRSVTVIAMAALIGSAPPASGDDLITVFQYELSLNGGPPVSTFSLAYQPDGWSQGTGFETDSKPAALRLPVYSTDSTMRTTFSTFSTAMRTAPGEETTVGGVLTGLVAVTLYVGLPLYALAKELEKTSTPDLPDIEYPDIDPALLGPTPANRDPAEGQ